MLLKDLVDRLDRCRPDLIRVGSSTASISGNGTPVGRGIDGRGHKRVSQDLQGYTSPPGSDSACPGCAGQIGRAGQIFVVDHFDIMVTCVSA